MKDDPFQIPEDMATEVLELASRYYERSQNSYSLHELQEAGSEVEIPPEFVEKAIQEVRARRRQEVQRQQEAQQRQKQAQIIGAGVAIAIGIWGIFTYNSLASRAQIVAAKWSQVENQLQRRADLIPTLVSVAKAQTVAEKEIVAMLVRSRDRYLQAANLAQKQAAIAEIDAALDRFTQYAAGRSEFQSSQAFQNLTYEIAGTENRIAVERMRYNQAVQAYNQKVKSFPNSLIAGLTGFSPKPFFLAENQDIPSIK